MRVEEMRRYQQLYVVQRAYMHVGREMLLDPSPDFLHEFRQLRGELLGIGGPLGELVFQVLGIKRAAGAHDVKERPLPRLFHGGHAILGGDKIGVESERRYSAATQRLA